MRVVRASISTASKNSADIKISNGMREFIVSIKKEDLSFQDLVNDSVEVKVYSMVRNCCAACPMYILESGKDENDDKEIKELLLDIIKLIGDELSEKLG